MGSILGGAVVIVGLLVVACAPAQPAAPAAQPAKAAPVAKPAAAGPFSPDPQLLEAAKKEGEVVWYSGISQVLVERAAKAFEAHTGIKVQGTRLSAGPIYDRLMRERQAGLKVTDVIAHGDSALFLDYKKRGMLERYAPRGSERLPSQYRDPDGLFYPLWAAAFSISYNTRSIAAADAPRRYGDAADPKYKGKLAMADLRHSGTTNEFVFVLNKLYGWAYFEKLRANQIRLFRSGLELAPPMVSGETPVVLGIPIQAARPEKQKGSPIEIVFPEEGLFTATGAAGVLKEAPHPNAAKLLLDYLFSVEYQTLLVGDGYYSPREDVPPAAGLPALRDIKVLTADLAEFVQVAEAQKQRWAELFGG